MPPPVLLLFCVVIVSLVINTCTIATLPLSSSSVYALTCCHPSIHPFSLMLFFVPFHLVYLLQSPHVFHSIVCSSYLLVMFHDPRVCYIFFLSSCSTTIVFVSSSISSSLSACCRLYVFIVRCCLGSSILLWFNLSRVYCCLSVI